MPRRRRSREKAAGGSRPSTSTREVHPDVPRQRVVSELQADRTPANRPVRIENAAQAIGLAQHLLDPKRPMPVAVVTTAAGASSPFVDVDTLADEVAGLAAVYLLPTGDPSWQFSRQLPDLTQVYGGASRVYPVEPSWQTNPRQSPLRFAYDQAGGVGVLNDLVDDVMAMAAAAGLTRHREVARVRPARGRVSGSAGKRGLVQVEGGSDWPATVVPGMVFPGVEIDNLIRKGMVVHGELDVDHNRLDIAAMALPWPQAVADLTVGDLVPARVACVEKGHVKVCLHPRLEVVVQAFDVVGPGEADLRGLFTVDEIVVVEVVAVGGSESKGWKLRVRDDVEDDQVRSACALLPGGPAWLTWPPVHEPEVAASPIAEPELPSAPSPEAHELAQVRTELEQQKTRVSRQLEELKDLKTSVRQLRSENQRLSGRARESERQLTAFRATAYDRDAVLFDDKEEQFRFDVHLAWAHRTTPADKVDHPIGRYSFGPDFFATLASVSGVSQNKVVEVVADVVSGRAWDSPGREAHQLRQGKGGDDPPVVGPSGENCWRIALQVSTPSARRLHFWQLNDGSYELSSIRLHDDFRP